MPTFGHIPQRLWVNISHKYLHVPINCSLVHNSQFKNPASGIYAQWRFIYSATKRSGIISFVGKRVQLEFITRSELGQMQKDKTSRCLSLLTLRILS